MAYAELLRATVFLTAGGATALAALSVVVIQRDLDQTIVLVAIAWWVGAALIGLWLGRPSAVAEGVRETLANARTVGPGSPGVTLPSPGRVAFGRLWPILAAVALAGGVGVLIPEVAVIGSGYALLVSLAWRNRESAVLAIEGRDGVRFLVESASGLKPIELIRSPGFTTF